MQDSYLTLNQKDMNVFSYAMELVSRGYIDTCNENIFKSFFRVTSKKHKAKSLFSELAIFGSFSI